jgi:hypothetical protein
MLIKKMVAPRRIVHFWGQIFILDFEMAKPPFVKNKDLTLLPKKEDFAASLNFLEQCQF